MTFLCAALLSASVLLLHGVLGIEIVSVSVMEGDLITLQSRYQKIQQDQIKWYFNGTRLAQINVNGSKICTDVECDGRFRNRLQIDNETGSLTIMNILMSDVGLYQLKIFKSPKNEKTFSVDVSGNFTTNQNNRVKAGEAVILNSGVRKKHDDLMTWYFNEILITEISGDKIEIYQGEDGRFRGRLQVNHQTGSLMIRDTRTSDSGQYSLHINSRVSIIKNFNLTVTDVETHILSSDIIVFTIVALVCLCFFMCIWWKAKQPLKYAVKTVPVKNGNSVTLSSNVSEIHKIKKMQWLFREKKSLIAQINGKTGEISTYEGPDGRFRDRLKLDNQTGSLTITNITAEDAGVYALKILRSKKTLMKFRVTVFEPDETRREETVVPLL